MTDSPPALTILLIEERPADARLVQEELGEHPVPIDLVVEPSFAAALARLEVDRFDCVLACYQLMAGDVAPGVREIRLRNPDTSVIVLLEFDDPDIVFPALASGAQECLVKSALDGGSLLTAVRRGVARQSAGIPPLAAVGDLEIDAHIAALEPVVRRLPVAIAAVDNRANVVLWNPACEVLFGWSASEVLGGPLPTFPDHEARETFATLFQSRRDGATLSDYEAVRRHKDGSLVNVSVTSAPLIDSAGDPIGMIAFTTDISGRKRTDAELRDSEERFRSIFEHSNDAIFILDPEKDEFLEINERVAEMLEYSVDELMRLHPSDIHPDEMPQLQAFAEVVKARGHGWTRDLTCRTKTGDKLPSEISASIISLEGRRWMIAVVRDVSPRVNAEAQLAEAEQELERRALRLSLAEAQLSDLARAVSHDLSEPLRTVSSYVQLLEQRYHDQLDQDATEFIGYAVDAVKRMRVLISDLLVLSRIGASGRPLTEVDTGRVVEDVVHDLAAGIEEAEAVVNAEGLPVVRGDEQELRQLFQNLIGNALKFRAPNRPPQVRVSVTRAEGAARFAVADNGVGIDAAHRERVFGVFRRLHPQDAYPGTGIGLAICKKVVDHHGGRIWVESEVDQGSTFYFTVPDQQA
ncbi:MAG: hypothetical protein BMS9Abin07_0811 [Acidimicrobiia bacterium]|nr:MAG: hypothetical protein BMS9Abin07_0811 [Acidimicrobiia bacterium]